MIIIVMYKKRHVIAVYFSVVDKQQIKEGNDDRDSFFFQISFFTLLAYKQFGPPHYIPSPSMNVNNPTNFRR